MLRTTKWGTRKMAMLSLAAIMMCALWLSGCSTGKSNQEAATSSSPAAQTPSAASPEPSVEQGDNELEPVQLVWYLRQAEPNHAEAVLKKFNEMVFDKIKATVDIKFINPGDYDNKMQLIMSSGEKYDLAFTASWANNYLNNVSKGAYLPLDEYIDKFPDLKGLFKAGIWDAVRVDGKIYGVPNNQIMASQHGLWFKKDLLDKYSIDLSQVKSLEDLTPIYQKIKDNEPTVIPVRQGYPYLFIDYLPTANNSKIDMNTLKVIDDTAQMLPRYQLMREWHEKGFFPQDVATMKNEEALIKEGKIFSRYSRYKPGNTAELQAKYGYEFADITAGPAVINQSSILSTLTAVSATSANPERAVMLLDLLNKDKDIFNTLAFGLEGQDYDKVGDNRIQPKEDAYAVANWTVGNVFNSYLLPGQEDDVWEKTKELNESAILDPLMGFSFDRTQVESEVARLDAVSKEFIPVLESGLDDADKTMKAYLDKQKASGKEKVVAEIERQLAAWKK